MNVYEDEHHVIRVLEMDDGTRIEKILAQMTPSVQLCKCGGNRFYRASIKPTKNNYDGLIIQCAHCDAKGNNK